MAVTTQKSTEYTNATATPVTLNEANVYHGRVRIAYFTHDQDGVGDAGSSVALCSLPAGKVKVLLSQSKAYVNWTTGSATLDLGWDAYTNISGTAVAADPGELRPVAVDRQRVPVDVGIRENEPGGRPRDAVRG